MSIKKECSNYPKEKNDGHKSKILTATQENNWEHWLSVANVQIPNLNESIEEKTESLKQLKKIELEKTKKLKAEINKEVPKYTKVEQKLIQKAIDKLFDTCEGARLVGDEESPENKKYLSCSSVKRNKAGEIVIIKIIQTNPKNVINSKVELDLNGISTNTSERLNKEESFTVHVGKPSKNSKGKTIQIFSTWSDNRQGSMPSMFDDPDYVDDNLKDTNIKKAEALSTIEKEEQRLRNQGTQASNDKAVFSSKIKKTDKAFITKEIQQLHESILKALDDKVNITYDYTGFKMQQIGLPDNLKKDKLTQEERKRWKKLLKTANKQAPIKKKALEEVNEKLEDLKTQLEKLESEKTKELTVERNKEKERLETTPIKEGMNYTAEEVELARIGLTNIFYHYVATGETDKQLFCDHMNIEKDKKGNIIRKSVNIVLIDKEELKKINPKSLNGIFTDNSAKKLLDTSDQFEVLLRNEDKKTGEWETLIGRGW